MLKHTIVHDCIYQLNKIHIEIYIKKPHYYIVCI
jgi:hypothetical protein